MEERIARLHLPNGLKLPVIIYASGGENDVIEYQPLQVSIGPNDDSDIFIVNPLEAKITPVGEPANGYQKVEVETEKGPKTFFMPTT